MLRNYEGYVTTYIEPTHYEKIDPSLTAAYQKEISDTGQEGVAGLLAGDAMFIKPEGFDQLHQRGGERHRLRDRTEKWIPRGIGDGRQKDAED